MNPDILEEEPITVYELQKEIKRIKKKDEELNIRGNKTEEYINDFNTLSLKDADALKKDIKGLKIPRLKENMVCKIVDVLPATLDEMKVVLQGYVLTISKDNMKKIVDVIKKYLPE